MKNVLILVVLMTFASIGLAADIPYQGKAVLVTGASSGLGKRIAETLAEKGVFVYAGARKSHDIERLSKNKNMLGIRLDVTKDDDIAAAVKLVEQQGRGLHGLVNNAGVFIYSPMIEVSEKEMDFLMDVNVYGPYRVTKAFAPLIMKSKGRISSTGSVAGFSSGPMFGPYSMSKFAVEAYTDALAGEMAKFDVKVSVIEPGNFQSNIMENMHKRLAKLKSNNQSTQYEDEYKRMVGFTKSDRSQHKDPQPVADAVVHALFSATPKLRYLVVPNAREAGYAIGGLMKKIAQVNADHEFSMTRDQLISILDAQLAKQAAATQPSSSKGTSSQGE
ncbi:hypothetical protein NBRC116583_38830 [Arenicella sp. 4NH20-0111]|uniref:SDR family oxidoreductase n=1 Tax=Arenicella sp. 4NH20-0111 TaxID=3127648 RepID=UPI0031079299